MKFFDFCSSMPSLSIILSNAFVLGFRHGIDWDHLAAIGDIVGASSAAGGAASTATVSGARSLYLAFLYAVGHSLVVILLSFLALAFAAELPVAISQGMEMLVGVTLVVFGIGVAVSVFRLARGEDAPILSRGAILLSVFHHIRNWVQSLLSGSKKEKLPFTFSQYGAGAAMGMGMLHGLGAETATQLLIIGAVGSTTSRETAVALLLAFVSGFVVSNTAIAALFSAGILTSTAVKPLYYALGILASILSVVVGVLYIVGQAECLPQLQHIWGGYGSSQ